MDDDVYYRGALLNSLKRAGHEVAEAEDGEDAKSKILAEQFELVVSDIRMPVMDGIQLLKWIRSESGPPVILITGFSDLLETRQAAELGASEFLVKPFHFADIEAAIAHVAQKASAAAVDENIDSQYCKIPLEDFISGSRICFDIYLRISSSRYLKVAYGGEDIAVDRIRSYKTKGLRHLFLSRKDFAKYVGFNLSIAKKLKNTKAISNEKKQTFLRYSGEVVLEQLFLEGADTEEFSDAKDFVQATLDIVQDNEAALGLLETLNSHADYVYAQSLGVSLYAVMVARKMNWHSAPTLFKVSLAGLMHDVGLKEIPRQILEKGRTALTAEERAVFETHPNRAMELLNQIKGIPADAILVAYQHHENWTGFGYPQKLSRNKTHPIARLIHVVDLFCDYAIEAPGTPKLSAKDAIGQMTQFYESSLDPMAFTALKSVFSA